MKVLMTAFFALLLMGTVFAEINDFNNVPYSPGFYLQGYPAYSTASNAYDSDGESQDMGDTWSNIRMSLRPTYWGEMNDKRWQVSANLPFNSYSYGSSSEAGIGDLSLSAAYWFIDDHKKGSYFSVWFWADIPVGDDAKGLGTGQMNIRPGVAWATEKVPYQIQASFYYNLRMENSDSDVQPGGEIWANASFGYVVNEQMMPGLEIETGWGQDTKFSGVSIPDTKSQWFRVGPSLDYQVNPTTSFKFKVLYMAMGKNTSQSIDIGARVTWGF